MIAIGMSSSGKVARHRRQLAVLIASCATFLVVATGSSDAAGARSIAQKGPVFDVPGLTAGVSEIFAHGSETCALVNGETFCWGDAIRSDSPVRVESIPIGAAGLFPASTKPGVCAILSGQISCPGEFNSTTESAALPALGSGVFSVSEGCAIVSDAAKCWGKGQWGQLGNATNGDSPTPVSVAGLSSGVSAISANGQTACAVVLGAAKCWGAGYKGALGNALTEDSNVPVQVAGLTSGVTSIDTRSWPLACAAANGIASCWGHGSKGNAANGSRSVHATPVAVAGLTNNVTAVSVGFAHTCVIDAGAAKCWGSGTHGQLGNGTYRSSKTPVQVKGLTTGVTAISAGYEHTCAIVNGAIKCWGSGDRGQIGAPLVLTSPKSVRFQRRFTLSLSTPAYSRVTLKLKIGKKTLWSSGFYHGALYTRLYKGGEFRFKLNLERHVFSRLRYPRGAPFATARINEIKRLLARRGSGSLVLTPRLVDGSSAGKPVTLKLY